jgi:hypothetical protein
MGPLQRPQLSASPTRTRTRRLCSGHNYAGVPVNEGLTGAPFLAIRVQSAEGSDLSLVFVGGRETAIEDAELAALVAHNAPTARVQR